MTTEEMIIRLAEMPLHAVVKAWDPNTEQYEEVTGFLFLPTTAESRATLELQTDIP